MSKRKRATARKLKALSAAQSLASSAAKSSAAETVVLRTKVADLERQVVHEKENARSITDMIGGFKLYLAKPEHIRGMRFEEYRLQISIMPELYAQSFLYGGSGDFLNISRYVRMVGHDVAFKIEKMLMEHLDKKMGRAG